MRPGGVNIPILPSFLCNCLRPRKRVGRLTFRTVNAGQPDPAQIWFSLARARGAAGWGGLTGDQFHEVIASVAESVELGVTQMNVEVDRLPRLYLDIFLPEREE